MLEIGNVYLTLNRLDIAESIQMIGKNVEIWDIYHP
jgi:hypothetical protein